MRIALRIVLPLIALSAMVLPSKSQGGGEFVIMVMSYVRAIDCAEKYGTFTKIQLDAAQNNIKKYIKENGVSDKDIKDTWDVSQQAVAADPFGIGDCVGVEKQISSMFPTLFYEESENPFK